MWSNPRQLQVALIAALAAVLLAAWCGSAAGREAMRAQAQGGCPGWQPCSSIWSSYGQLSHEQQQALQRIYGEYSGRLYELKSLIYAKKAELDAHLSKDEIDPGAIDDLVAVFSELYSEYLATRVEMIVKMRQNGLPFYGWGGHGPLPDAGFGVPGANRSRTW